MADPGAIFTDILTRRHLRREAKLPLLDVHVVYRREVEQALWREHVRQHHEEVRAQVFDDLRQRLGREPLSAGGRWAVNAMVTKTLAESFTGPRTIDPTISEVVAHQHGEMPDSTIIGSSPGLSC